MSQRNNIYYIKQQNKILSKVLDKSRIFISKINYLATKIRYIGNRWERRYVNIQDLVGGSDVWEETGRRVFNFLLQVGLKPNSTVLDAGCGSFRIGRFLINYLDSGCYSGFDGSRYLLTEGIRQVLSKECNLDEKKIKVRHIFIKDKPIDLFKKFNQKYDLILAHAIFDHLPPGSIKAFLQSFTYVMHAKTKIYASFFLNPYGEDYKEPIKRLRRGKEEGSILTYPDREYWHHTPQFFQKICDEINNTISWVKIRYVKYYDFDYPFDGLKIGEFEAVL